MIKVLEKSFGILEAVALRAPLPSTPLELAARLGINRATCSRLLRELCDAGYLQDLPRRRGYLPAPRLLTLGNAAGIRDRLLDFARPVADRCAAELRNSVVLAVLHRGRRYVLHLRNCNPSVKIALDRLAFDDVFETATGAVLAAELPEEEALALFRASAPPRSVCAVRSEAELLELLAAIRREKFFAAPKPEAFQWIYAAPIFENGVCSAALGVSIPEREHSASFHRRICEVLRRAVREIGAAVSPVSAVG